MKFEAAERLNDEKFKRTTFDKMAGILADAHKVKHNKGRWENKLNAGDRLLMTLEYLREYQPYFHKGAFKKRRCL